MLGELGIHLTCVKLHIAAVQLAAPAGAFLPQARLQDEEYIHSSVILCNTQQQSTLHYDT